MHDERGKINSKLASSNALLTVFWPSAHYIITLAVMLAQSACCNAFDAAALNFLSFFQADDHYRIRRANTYFF